MCIRDSHCEIPDASGTNQNIYVGVYYRGAPSFPTAAAWAAAARVAGAVVGVLLLTLLTTTVFVLAILAMRRYCQCNGHLQCKPSMCNYSRLRTQNKNIHQVTGRSESPEGSDLTLPPLDQHMSCDSKGEHIELNECDSVAQEDKDTEQHIIDTSLTGQLECLKEHILI